MKKVFFAFTAIVICLAVTAQGNSGNKGKDKQKDKDKPVQTASKYNEQQAKNDKHDRLVWDGISDNSCMKTSKNQPAKVRAAFQRDYPLASVIRWTKCRGDWTATFGNGLWMSTAVYHANGDRRDTRTPIGRDNIPRRVLDEILKRMPGIILDGAIKIEVPNIINDIFRIKNMLNGKADYQYYNAEGVQLTYSY
jgi:predicted small lipoprotein YifL